jgi:hypothetical protein
MVFSRRRMRQIRKCQGRENSDGYVNDSGDGTGFQRQVARDRVP